MKSRSKKIIVRIRRDEANEDIGTARLVTRARKEIAAGASPIPKDVVDRIAIAKNTQRRRSTA
jgi:hypothetical protein